MTTKQGQKITVIKEGYVYAISLKPTGTTLSGFITRSVATKFAIKHL